jgi:hypothetical protein
MRRRLERVRPPHLTTHQVWALALLFGLLAASALVTYVWNGAGRAGDPKLTGAPRDLVLPTGPYGPAPVPAERGDGR